MEEVYGVEDVFFSYDGNGGGAEALNGISFSVRRGESLAVLGANGSGKSTLLKLLDGLIHPCRGGLRYFGRALDAFSLKGAFLKEFRSGVGFVFPDPDPQLFCPTVFEELAFGPLQLDVRPDEVSGRVEDLLRILGMAHLKDRQPYTLSGGEKKKVAIASVLSTGPDVLLMDEPTNGLDPRSQVWLYGLLEGLKAAGKTVIISTHDLSLAEDFSDRAIVLDEAHRIAGDGPTASILRDKALLLGANLIHEHAHRHGKIIHIHSHGPYSTHDDHDG